MSLDNREGLRSALETDGYVHLRGALPREAALAAREEVLTRLAEVGEIAEPATEGRFTGQSRRKEVAGGLGAFWKSVNDGPCLRAVTHGPALGALASAVLGAPSRGHDYMFLRVGVAGRGTSLHCDYPFFTRATERVITCWVALSDIELAQGPIYVVDGSHKFVDHVAGMRGFDLARNPQGRRATLAEDPIAFARARGARLLTSSFRAGDILLFGMFLIHGAFDNRAPERPVRLSCDVRYQPESEPFDPRYVGPDPGGTFGGGYAELNGAKPLTEEWHQR